MSNVNADTDTTWPAKGSGVDDYPDSPGPVVDGWPSNHSQDADSSYPDANKPGYGGDTYPDSQGSPVDSWPSH